MNRFSQPGRSDPSSSLAEFKEIWTAQREAAEKKRIQLEIFRGHKYCTDEEIDSDLAEVRRIDQQIMEKEKNDPPEVRAVNSNARIVETLLPEVISRYRWFGKNAKMIYTSRYDDLKNGVDSVAQFVSPVDTRHLGFEIDFASSEREMVDKIMKIKADLERGRIYKVKYFDSPMTGKLKNLKMPKVAFGAPFKSILDFFELLAVAYKEPNNREAELELEHHPLRDKMFRQISAQLEQFRNILTDLGNREYAESYQKAFDALQNVQLPAQVGDIKKAA